MESNFITGMQSGVQAGNEMIYGGEQAKAQTQLLSTKAQEAQLQLKQEKSAYGAKLALYSAQSNWAKAHSDAQLGTYQGIDKMYGDLAKSPEIVNSPEAMMQLMQNKRDNVKLMADEQKNNLAIQTEQAQGVDDTLNRALLNPTDPNGWKEVMGSASYNPTMQMQLGKMQKYFNSEVPDREGKLFKDLTPDQQDIKIRKALSGFNTGKQVTQAAQQIAGTVAKTKSQEEIDRENKAKDAARIKDQALKQQKMDEERKKIADKEQKDFIAQDAKQRNTMTTAVQKMETQQREILSSVGLSDAKDKQGYWMFKKGLEDHPAAKAAFDQLEIQKAQRVRDFNNYKIDVIKKMGKAPSSGPGSTKADPLKVTSEELAHELPKGTYFEIDGKIGHIE